VKTTVHHDAQLIGDSLWHVQPMELIMQECRQTTVELPCVTDHVLLVVFSLLYTGFGSSEDCLEYNREDKAVGHWAGVRYVLFTS